MTKSASEFDKALLAPSQGAFFALLAYSVLIPIFATAIWIVQDDHPYGLIFGFLLAASAPIILAVLLILIVFPALGRQSSIKTLGGSLIGPLLWIAFEAAPRIGDPNSLEGLIFSTALYSRASFVLVFSFMTACTFLAIRRACFSMAR